MQVPNLVGKSEADARAALDNGRPDRQGAAREPLLGRRRGRAGREAGHARPGSPCTKGTAVSFDLANSPCTVDVPNVRSAPRRQAVRAAPGETIATANIKIVHQTVTEPSQDGIVLDQDIEGTNAKPFVVTLTVGQLDTSATTTTTPTP